MTITLSDSARVLLSNASQHDAGFANPTILKMPAGARSQVIKGLIKRDLLTWVRATNAVAGLIALEDGNGAFVAKITDEGLRAIGIDPNEGQPEPDASGIEGSVPDAEGAELAAMAEAASDGQAWPHAPEGGEAGEQRDHDPDAPVFGADTPAPQAAGHRAFLVTFSCEMGDDTADRISALLRSAGGSLGLALEAVATHGKATKPAKAPRDPAAPRAPRDGTKQEAVIAMLKAEGGATVAAIAEATDWQAHTVRGFFAGLKKKGIDVASTKVEKTDAAAAHTVYSIR